jgi:hypothetical protein
MIGRLVSPVTARSGPSATARVVGVVDAGTVVQCSDTVNGGWLQVVLADGHTAFLPPGSRAEWWTPAEIRSRGVSLRLEPVRGAERVRELARGEVVELVNMAELDGLTWVGVRCQDGSIGFVSGNARGRVYDGRLHDGTRAVVGGILLMLAGMAALVVGLAIGRVYLASVALFLWGGGVLGRNEATSRGCFLRDLAPGLPIGTEDVQRARRAAAGRRRPPDPADRRSPAS